MKIGKTVLILAIALTSCQLRPGEKNPEPWSDTEPPVLVVNEIFDGLQTGLTLAVDGTAYDNVEVEGVYLTVDSATNEKLPGTTNWLTNLTLASGSHILSFYAKDTAGLISPFQTFSVTASATPDTNIPSVSITYPDGINPAGFSFTASGTASDNSALEGVYLSLDFGNFRKLAGTATWSSDLSVSLTGVHQVSVYARDMSGNRSVTNNRVFIVNPSIPTVEITTPSNQQYTSNTVLAVTGRASDDGTLAGVFVELGTNGYGPAGGTTNWQTNIALPAVSGWYALHAYSRDTLSNQSTPAVASVFLDLISPTNAINAPTNGQLVLYSTFSAYGKITDNTLPLEGLSVRMRQNGGPEMTVAADRYGNWLTNLTLTNAWYTNTVYALDAVGNSSATDTIVFRVKADVEFPVADITNIPNGGAVTNPIRFTGVASDDTAVSMVYLILDGTLTNTATGAEGWTCGPFTLSNGFHQADVYAVDVYGRVGAKKGISFFADTQAPIVTFSYSNVTDLDYYYRYDLEDGGGIYKFAYVYTGIAWVTNTNAGYPDSLVVENTLTLTQGVYLFRSFAEDRFGHQTAILSNTLIADTNGPSAFITAPTNGQYVKNPVTINGTGRDNIGVQGIYLAVNGTNFIQAASTNAYLTNLAWTLTTNLPEGTNVLDAYAYDFVFQISSTNRTEFVVDLTSPTLSGVSPADGETWPESFSYSGSASDNYLLSGVFISVDGSVFRKAAGLVSWNTNLTLTAGPHVLRAYAADSAGNCSLTNTANVTVTN